MLDRTASSSFLCSVIVVILSPSCAAIVLSDPARAANSAESGIGTRRSNSPAANRSAICLMATMGWLIRREISRLSTAAPAAMTRPAHSMLT